MYLKCRKCNGSLANFVSWDKNNSGQMSYIVGEFCLFCYDPQEITTVETDYPDSHTEDMS
jgi:hypothetical protein